MISCPRCPGAELVDNYETGDVVCPECGLVVLDRVIDVQWPVLDTNVQQCRVTKIKTVNEMGQKLHLPETVLEKACLLFKPVSGRSNEAVYAACLYMACRQERVPRTFKEICAVSTVSKKEIGRAYKQISRVVVERVTPDDLVNRFCSKLGLTRQVRRANRQKCRDWKTTVLGCSSSDLFDLGQISERNQGGYRCFRGHH